MAVSMSRQSLGSLGPQDVLWQQLPLPIIHGRSLPPPCNLCGSPVTTPRSRRSDTGRWRPTWRRGTRRPLVLPNTTNNLQIAAAQRYQKTPPAASQARGRVPEPPESNCSSFHGGSCVCHSSLYLHELKTENPAGFLFALNRLGRPVTAKMRRE